MKNSRTSTIALAFGFALILAAAPAMSQGRDSCLLVEAPGPVTLPDGSTQVSGKVKLCLRQMWTPVSGLHEIHIGKTCLGLYMSRVGESEGRISDRPVVVFQRDQVGEYYLIGYAWPDGDAMKTYVLHEFGEPLVASTELPLVDSDRTDVVAAAVVR